MPRIVIVTHDGRRLVTHDNRVLVAEYGAVDVVSEQERYLNYLVEMEFTDGWLRLWTGYPDILFEGNTWIGMGGMLVVAPAENSIGKPDDLVTLTLSNIHPSVRPKFRNPMGQRYTSIRLVMSTDSGLSWQPLPMKRVGYTSNLRNEGGTAQVDIVHPYEIAFRRRPQMWSNDDQRRKYPTDSGLSQMRAVAEGINIQFPYLKHNRDKFRR